MNTINFSLRIWGITQLLFNGLALLLSAFSIIPLMLVPALAGGLCSLFFFSLFLTGILKFTKKRHAAFLLVILAVVVSCFIPLYGFTYLQSGSLVLWDTHSKLYPAILVAAGCGVIATLICQRDLFLMQRNRLALLMSRKHG